MTLSLVKTDAKPAKAKQKKKRTSMKRTVVLGDMLHTKKYDSFESLRRISNKALSQMRENWLRDALRIHGIDYTKEDLTKREIQERLSESGIRIERVKDKGKDTDKVFKNDVLIAEWNNEREISIDFDGRLCVTIEYYIKPSAN